MNNYEYIIASLPELARETTFNESFSLTTAVGQIRPQLSKKDGEALDLLLEGFDAQKLCKDFYVRALAHPNPFLRNYFSFDLDMRNTKAAYLNGRLGRPADADLVFLDEDGGEDALQYDERPAVEAVLAMTDLLGREKGLDDILWNKIDELSVFDWFDLDAVLAYIAKMQIIDRWYKLDEKTGKEYFRKLVEGVRGTFKGVDYHPDNL